MQPLAIILDRINFKHPHQDRGFCQAALSQRVARGGGGALAACSCWLFSFPVPLPTLPVLPGIFSQIKDLPPTHRLKLCFLEKLNQCTCDISMRAAGVTWPPPPESPRSI